MKKLLAFFLIVSAGICARESVDVFPEEPSPSPTTPANPWLTGPLLTPSGHTVPVGHQNYEPYVYWTQNRGKYDPQWNSHSTPQLTSVLTQATFQIGVAPATEFDFAPQFYYNKTQGEHAWVVGDLPVTLAFQILADKPHNWVPAVKLRFAANLPIGKYDRLSPHKLGTDIGGSGNWNPQLGLVATRIIHFYGAHWLAWRFFLNYSFGVPVHVHGSSAYGGAHKTRGTVYPGNAFLSLLGLEYTLSQNWALALDVQYQHTNKNRFSGRNGGSSPIAPSSEMVALAPAIEYNWNTNIGIIFGPWFTVAGRNTTQFISWVGALNIYH